MVKKLKPPSTALVKFHLPTDMKIDLERVAEEKHISLSALMRLIASEYIRHKGGR